MKARVIRGYDDYLISCKGVIISLKNRKPREKRSRVNKRGYVQVGLHKDTKIHAKYVHRLVAEAFIENPDNKEEVNHKNGIKTDNSIGNLEWMTKSENNQHAYDTGLRVHKGLRGEYNKTSKLKNNDIIKIMELIQKGFSDSEIAENYPVKKSSISSIRNGKSWTHITNRVQELEK